MFDVLWVVGLFHLSGCSKRLDHYKNAWKHGLRSAGEIEDRKRVNDVMRRCQVAINKLRESSGDETEPRRARQQQDDWR
jgi:hypothetical protein